LTIKSISNTKYSRAQRTLRPVRASIRCQFLRCFPSGGDMWLLFPRKTEPFGPSRFVKTTHLWEACKYL